jgi:osmotically-inducible protein OsmY
MKLYKRFIAFTFAIVAFSFVNVSAQGLSGHAAASTTLGQQVFKKILRLPYYEVYDHIGFSIDGSTVTLTGKVRNGVNRSDAKAAVERIPGVTNVINNIEILPPSRFDDDIRRALYARIANTGGLSGYIWPNNPAVRLIVDNGRISLEGTVRHRGDYDTMNIIARSIPNSFTVTNNLQIENDRPN